MGTKSWIALAGAAILAGAALGFVASLVRPRTYGMHWVDEAADEDGP